MTEMEQARRAGGSGPVFTTAVVLGILVCIGLLIWDATSNDGPEQPPAAAMQSR